MKKVLFIIAFAMFATFSFGQARNNTNLNVGVGFSSWGVPVYIGADFGVGNDFSLGLEFSYRNYRENWSNNYYNRSIMGFSGNANYHFNRILQIPSKWDVYAGLNLGFYVWSANNHHDYDGNNASGIGLGGQIGARYFITNRLGLNLEFGGGNAFSGGKFGLTFKL